MSEFELSDVGRIQMAIRHAHACDSRFVESVSVYEVFDGNVVWDGTVEVFELIDHPQTKQCYGWSYLEGDFDPIKKFVTILAVPPVTSPNAAVHSYLAGLWGKQAGGKSIVMPVTKDQPTTRHKAGCLSVAGIGLIGCALFLPNGASREAKPFFQIAQQSSWFVWGEWSAALCSLKIVLLAMGIACLVLALRGILKTYRNFIGTSIIFLGSIAACLTFLGVYYFLRALL